jgi:hypothetical protein
VTVRSRTRAQQPVVLVFGENINDARAIAELVMAANPRLTGRVRARPRPTSLTRGAGERAVRNWVLEIGAVVRATRAVGTPVAAVVVHRDADCPDVGGTVEAELKAELTSVAGLPAVPVQTIEAWWFLFPDAVEAVRPIAWRGSLPRSPRDVEAIARPKEELQRLTRRGGSAEYAESDSPFIAQKIRELNPPRCGKSASYDRLTGMAARLR